MKNFRLLSPLLALVLVLGAFTTPAAALEDPSLTATSAILVDVTYGTEVLYERAAHERIYPTGLTKVMTALLAVEAVERGELSLDQQVTASSGINQGIMAGATIADIKVGETMTVRDVLACVMIPSANDACNFLAEVVSGNISTFVAAMNQRSEELGCEDTHFTNPHGLHDSEQYSTAWDLFLICQAAMENPTFRELASVGQYVVPATNLYDQRILHDTNSLISTHIRIGYYYQYATGIQTGASDESGRCLAASATRGERSLIAIIMGCERPAGSAAGEGFLEFTEGKRLLEWGFNNFSRQTILTSTDLQGDIPVTLSQTAFVAAQPNGTLEATLPDDVDISSFTYDTEYFSESVQAPVEKGQLLGTITVSYGDRVFGTLDLVAVSDVERSGYLFFRERISTYFSQLWVKIVLVILILSILIVVVWTVFFEKRGGSGSRYSGSRGYRGGRRLR